MPPVNEKVIAAKVEIIRRMMEGIPLLHLESKNEFVSDFVRVSAGESMLRRSLEALLDIGRHILAKAFSIAAVEYKQIGRELGVAGVLKSETTALLVEMAGYRNRLTHFYAEVSPEELHEILTTRRADIESVLGEILLWLRLNPDKIDTSL